MSKQFTILVADDDELITDVLHTELSREGYNTLICHDGEEALAMARANSPDLLLLDLMMPKRNGWEVCRELRAESSIPIMMLTARGEETDTVMGLKLGADDYLVKPFGLMELLARVEALLRRTQTAKNTKTRQDSEELFTLGHLTIDLGRHTITSGDQQISLAHQEFELFLVLLLANGSVIERDELLDQAWGEAWIGDTRTLDVHIRRLRNKLELDPSNPQLILTVRGVGYRIISPSEVSSE